MRRLEDVRTVHRCRQSREVPSPTECVQTNEAAFQIEFSLAIRCDEYKQMLLSVIIQRSDRIFGNSTCTERLQVILGRRLTTTYSALGIGTLPMY